MYVDLINHHAPHTKPISRGSQVFKVFILCSVCSLVCLYVNCTHLVAEGNHNYTYQGKTSPRVFLDHRGTNKQHTHRHDLLVHL